MARGEVRLEEDYLDYQRRLAEAKDPPEEAGVPTYNVPGMGLELPYTESGLETGVGLRRRFGLLEGESGGQQGGGEPGPEPMSWSEARSVMEDYLYTPEGIPSTSITPEQEGRIVPGLAKGDPSAWSTLDRLTAAATAPP